MGNIYGIDAGEVYWAASDVGWVVGHSYIVYAPLFKGCTSILYEGKPVGTPDPGAFWRVISEHGVNVMFTAPTAFRAIKPGSCTKPVPGFDVRVLDESAKEVAADQIGSIAIKLPLPPGCLPTLWNNDIGYQEAYLNAFPGFYTTADAGYKDEDGYLWIMSRTDDIINVAGHRLSTGAMEEVLASHPDVAECAVLGVADEIKGEVPLGTIVLKAGVERAHDEIIQELIQMVREKIGPVASFKKAAVVKRLPKTRSGKTLRGTVKKIADGVDYKMPATIDDPAILDEIAEAIAVLGYPKPK